MHQRLLMRLGGRANGTPSRGNPPGVVPEKLRDLAAGLRRTFTQKPASGGKNPATKQSQTNGTADRGIISASGEGRGGGAAGLRRRECAKRALISQER